jgi:hypothetical protein
MKLPSFKSNGPTGTGSGPLSPSPKPEVSSLKAPTKDLSKVQTIKDIIAPQSLSVDPN